MILLIFLNFFHENIICGYQLGTTNEYQQDDFITKTRLFKYTENFTTKKWRFSDKNSDIFHISAQNIDYGYSLELPQEGSSNE